MIHILTIKFTAFHSDAPTSTELVKTFTGAHKNSCNIQATRYLNKLRKSGFQILDIQREDEET